MVPVIRNRNWLPNWLDDFFGDDWTFNRTNQFASPSVNIIEKEKNFCIEVAAPGMTRNDFHVCVNEGNELVVSLEKYCGADKEPAPEGKQTHDNTYDTQQQHAKTGGNNDNNKQTAAPAKDDAKEKTTYLRREFSYGSFRRSFILPDNVDKSKISATMKHGVLTIQLPKKEEDKTTPAVREIAIG